MYKSNVKIPLKHNVYCLLALGLHEYKKTSIPGLRTLDGYSLGGVLCDLYDMTEVIPKTGKSLWVQSRRQFASEYNEYDGHIWYVPKCVADWAGLDDNYREKFNDFDTLWQTKPKWPSTTHLKRIFCPITADAERRSKNRKVKGEGTMIVNRVDLEKLKDYAMQSYFKNRSFIDANVPDWANGDDGPSYPSLVIYNRLKEMLENDSPPDKELSKETLEKHKWNNFNRLERKPDIPE